MDDEGKTNDPAQKNAGTAAYAEALIAAVADC
jgi:hypothetical protein